MSFLATRPLFQLEVADLRRHGRRCQRDRSVANAVERAAGGLLAPFLVGEEHDSEQRQGEVVFLRSPGPALAVPKSDQLLAVAEERVFDAPAVGVQLLDPPAPPVGVARGQKPQRAVAFGAAGNDPDAAPDGQAGNDAVAVLWRAAGGGLGLP